MDSQQLQCTVTYPTFDEDSTPSDVIAVRSFVCSLPSSPSVVAVRCSLFVVRCSLFVVRRRRHRHRRRRRRRRLLLFVIVFCVGGGGRRLLSLLLVTATLLVIVRGDDVACTIVRPSFVLRYLHVID